MSATQEAIENMAGRTSEELTLYTPEVFDAVIENMGSGMSVNKACEQAGVKRQTFYGWVSGLRTMKMLGEEGVNALRDKYMRARPIQADAVVDDISSCREALDKEGIDSNEIQRHRARADIGIRLAPLLAPRVYGAKVELSGPDGGPLQVAVMNYGDAAQVERVIGPVIEHSVLPAIEGN